MLVRRIARPLLASTFVFGGIDTLRNPQSRVAGARPVVEKVTAQADKQLPVQVPRDVEQWVKIDAAVKVGAGTLFSLGRLPRLSALTLAATIVPTTLAGHRFWEAEGTAKQRAAHPLPEEPGAAGRSAARRRRHRGQALGGLPRSPRGEEGHRIDGEEPRAGPEARRQGAEEDREAPEEGLEVRTAELTAPLTPAAALRRIAFLLERAREPSYRVQAFRTAATVVDGLSDDQLDLKIRTNTLKDLKGVGPKTAAVVVQAHKGQVPEYLTKLEEDLAELVPLADDVAEFRAALKGDLHLHSDWSDGGSPIREMAEAAMALGHEYIALTDHSPRLTVANGLSAARLEQQLDVVAALNEELAPFRILTGIECDINVDGSLDQTDELLGRLDVVVASVHSDLRADSSAMTARMLAAVADPHTDVLGHCTGRLVIGRRQRNGTQRPRPESTFDAEAVFRACVEHGTAVEINSRPERLDPPRRLLTLAVETGCEFAIDTDAHAPGQLDWQGNGCERAVECGVPVERVVNTWDAERLLSWTVT